MTPTQHPQLLECTPNVVTKLGPGDDDTTHVALNITTKNLAHLDLAFIFDVFRLVDKLIYDIDVHFLDSAKAASPPVTRVLKAQKLMAQYFVDNVGNKSIPPFVHNMRIRSQDTANELVTFCRYAPLIREFGIDRIETHLVTLVDVFTNKPNKHEIERIRIDRKWNQARRVPKMFTEKQRGLMQKLQQAIVTDTVPGFEILSSAEGAISRQQLSEMNLTDFANILSGTTIEKPNKNEVYEPQIYAECVTKPKDYYYPPVPSADDPDPMIEKLFLELPVVDTSLNLRKVSLCMVGLRRMLSGVRCDEWASGCRGIW